MRQNTVLCISQRAFSRNIKKVIGQPVGIGNMSSSKELNEGSFQFNIHVEDD